MKYEAQWVYSYICCIAFVSHVVYYLLNYETLVYCKVLIIGETLRVKYF